MKSLTKVICLAALCGGFAATNAVAETIKLQVLGQPLATGLIQANKEQPFFETLAETTGSFLMISCKSRAVLS